MNYRKVFICDACEGVYSDAPVTQCDCMPAVNSFTEPYILSGEEIEAVRKDGYNTGWSDGYDTGWDAGIDRGNE